MLRVLTAAALASLLCACEEEGVRTYRAPKPPAKAAAAAASSVTWTAPQGWEPVKSDQQMRIATFHPGPGQPEVSVTAFPGDSGGLLANINRWRTQLKLDPIEESQLPQSVEVSTTEGVKVALADLAGNNQQMLGAVIVPGDGKTWFVKATGEPAAIAALKPAFTAFARSFRFQPPAAAAPAAPQPTPAAPTSTVQSRLTAWSPPSHWKPDPKASSMVAAAFEAANPDGGAKITATVLVNNGGGKLANINRWRDQVGLPPVETIEQQPVIDLGNGNILVDLASADGARRQMAAVVSEQAQTWFFKIAGPPKGVEAERPAFERLIHSVGLGEP